MKTNVCAAICLPAMNLATILVPQQLEMPDLAHLERRLPGQDPDLSIISSWKLEPPWQLFRGALPLPAAPECTPHTARKALPLPAHGVQGQLPPLVFRWGY